MGKKYCELGECSTSYIYILFTNLFFFFKSSVLNLGELSFDTLINIFGIETVISKHVLIKLLLEYLGYIIFGLISQKILIKKKIFKKEEEEKESKNRSRKSNFLIFQVENFDKKTLLPLLIASSTFALQLIIRSILSYCSVWMLDLWIFNIIFISFFMTRIFKVRIYKHQLYSLIFIFIVSLILLITASCIKIDGVSDYDSINNLYGSYFFVLLFYLVYLILSSLICFSQVKQKQLMDFTYVSPFKILIVIGIFSSIFVSIALIVTSCAGCNELMVKNDICHISHPNYNNNTFYFDNLVVFFNNLGDQYNKDKISFFIEIFLVYPLYSLACFMKYFFEIMIIYHLNPNYVLISDNMYYGTRYLISLIYTPSNIKLYLNVFGNFFSLFLYFFYLEIIRFKCLGLDFNTRVSIKIRSQIESILDNSQDEEDESSSNDSDNI